MDDTTLAILRFGAAAVGGVAVGGVIGIGLIALFLRYLGDAIFDFAMGVR